MPLSGQVWPVTTTVPIGSFAATVAPGLAGLPILGGNAIAFLWLLKIALILLSLRSASAAYAPDACPTLPTVYAINRYFA
jgi:hypothetical protein